MLLNPLRREVSYRQGVPVLPGAFPVIGHTPGMMVNDLVELLSWGRQKLGPLFWMDWGLGFRPLMYLGHDSFELLRHPAASNEHLKRIHPHLFGPTVLALDGAEHHHIRSAMNPAFSARHIAQSGMGAEMAQRVQRRVASWRSRRMITILAETQELSLEIIFGILGVQVSELAIWRKQFHRLVLAGVRIPGLELLLGGKRAFDWTAAELSKMVESARRAAKGVSLLQTLVQAKDEAGQSLSAQELVDNLRFVVLAGHHTGATVMAWSVIMMAKQPELWMQLCEEVLSRPRPAIPTSLAEAKALPWTEALFRESLRMYGPLSLLLRQLTEPMKLNGHLIPKDTLVAISPTMIGRDASHFPNPERFDPGKWLGRHAPLSPVELIQFGGGPHFCLGYHLAWLEAIQLLSALALEFGKTRMRPRLLPFSKLKQVYVPLAHPASDTKIRFAT